MVPPLPEDWPASVRSLGCLPSQRHGCQICLTDDGKEDGQESLDNNLSNYIWEVGTSRRQVRSQSSGWRLKEAILFLPILHTNNSWTQQYTLFAFLCNLLDKSKMCLCRLVTNIFNTLRVGAQLPDPFFAAGRDHQSVSPAHLAPKEECCTLVASSTQPPNIISLIEHRVKDIYTYTQIYINSNNVFPLPHLFFSLGSFISYIFGYEFRCG